MISSHADFIVPSNSGPDGMSSMAQQRPSPANACSNHQGTKRASLPSWGLPSVGHPFGDGRVNHRALTQGHRSSKEAMRRSTSGQGILAKVRGHGVQIKTTGFVKTVISVSYTFSKCDWRIWIAHRGKYEHLLFSVSVLWLCSQEVTCPGCTLPSTSPQLGLAESQFQRIGAADNGWTCVYGLLSVHSMLVGL